MLTHDKSSHGLWPGELIRKLEFKSQQTSQILTTKIEHWKNQQYLDIQKIKGQMNIPQLIAMRNVTEKYYVKQKIWLAMNRS